MNTKDDTPSGIIAISRREALVKLLRLGAIGAGVAALGAWLSGRSHRPVEAVATNAKRSHTVAPGP